MAILVDDPVVKRNVRLIIFGVLAFAALTVFTLANKLSSPRILNTYELRDYGAMILDQPEGLGDIALIDHRGEVFGAEQLRGHWTLVFFGFTHCGDICPTTMAVLGETYRELKPKEKDDLNVVLVTVDPERDTPGALGKYLNRFDPDFIGLSGSQAEIMNFASKLHLAYEPELAGQNNYQVQHSGNLMLINPQGELHGYFLPPFAHGGLRVAWRSIRATY